MKIKAKLILLFLIIGLLPLLAVGLLGYTMAGTSVEKEIYRSLEIYSRVKDLSLRDYFAQREADVKAMAAASDVYQSLNLLGSLEEGTGSLLWAERLALLEVYGSKIADEYGFGFVFLTDTAGTVVYASRPEVIGASLAGRDYIAGSLNGALTWSELFYSDIIEENCLVVSTPVYSSGVSGPIVGSFNILFSDQNIESIVHEGLSALEAQADAYLVDDQGTLLSNTTLGQLSEEAVLSEALDSEAVRLLAERLLEGTVEFYAQLEYESYANNRVLGALSVTLLGDKPVGLIVEVNANEALGTLNSLRSYILGLGLILIILVIVAGLLVTRPLVRNVKDSTSFISNLLAQGDFSVDVPDYALKLKDEYGELARGLDTLTKNLRNLISQVVELANGVNSGSGAVSASAEEMSASLEEISASTNQFAGNAENLSSSSSAMAETSTQILNRAEEGNQAVADAMEQMQIINSRVSELQSVITEVDQRARDIGRILNVITEIADQTNLLALNAAIEAARAGEQGRGFAVVAEEVRKLAEQSANAATEIGEMILASQEESRKALESMNLGVQDVEAGTEVVARTGETFSNILNDVTAITGQISDVAAAAEELSAGSEEMAASVEEQSSTMEEMAATAQELRASAERLFQELQKFKYQ